MARSRVQPGSILRYIRTVAEAGTDKDLTDRELLRRFIASRQEGAVHGLAVSPDGKTLASGGEAGHIRFWDLATGKELRHIQARGVVVAVAFSPDGKALASGSTGTRGPQLWDAATGKALRRFK